MISGSPFSSLLDEASLVPRRSLLDEARFDITAMIDLVFMLNIFFLVTAVGAAMAEIDLPAARHCAPANRDDSVIISITGGAMGKAAMFHVGEGNPGEPRAADDRLERKIRAEIEAGVRAGKTIVLVKAEKSARLRDVAYVGKIAASVPGTTLKVSVIEME